MNSLFLGEPPFDGIPLKDLSERFYNDERPSCPENCSTRMHEIMKQCWKLQPIERPLFSQILREFGVDGPLVSLHQYTYPQPLSCYKPKQICCLKGSILALY